VDYNDDDLLHHMAAQTQNIHACSHNREEATQKYCTQNTNKIKYTELIKTGDLMYLLLIPIKMA